MTVHLLGRVAAIKGIKKVPKGIRHRKIRDQGIEESKKLVIRTRDISIRSGLSDLRKIWTVEKSKGDFHVSTS